MANENSYATFLANGGKVAALLSDMLHENLYDPVGLRFLMPQVPWRAGGSDSTTITKVTRGYAASAATSELIGGASNTLLSTGNYSHQVARYLLKMQNTDLWGITGGPIDTAYVVGVLVESLDLTLTDLMCSAFANIAGNVGTSGADLTVDDIFDGIYYLNLQNNGADIAAVLHNQQINDLMESIRGESGPMQWRTDAQNMLQPAGVGFRGEFAGVMFYQSDSVATANAGADRQGAMFTRGAWSYQLADVSDMDPEINPADIVVATPEMFVERNRDADNGMTTFLVNFYPSVKEQEDLRAVKVTTDA